MARGAAKSGNGKRLATQQSVNAAVKAICDIMRRSNCAGALQYVPELTWILFLRILDERETRERDETEAVGVEFTPSLEAPYRWQDWAAPDGGRRKALQDGTLGGFFAFVNGELLPHLKALRERPRATPRQKVISEIMSGVERTRIDTERNLLDVLDKVNELSGERVDPTHVFALSQVYEGLLLKMGEKGNDGGQFFTPREVIRAMVRVIDPRIGETEYDPGCGTGGFLAQAYEHMAGPGNAKIHSADQLDTLKRRTFYGREKDNAIYPIGLANLVLHDIDEPHIWHGNTLTGQETYGGLFTDAPALFDVILMNPPFGGKEGKEAQTRFAYKTRATQVLFLQHVIGALTPGGRCGISGIKVGKKSPLTLAHFEDFLRLLPDRTDSERSWTVDRKAIDEKGYDLKAVNPHAKKNEDLRTPEELLDLIEAKGREVAEAVATLRSLTRPRDE